MKVEEFELPIEGSLGKISSLQKYSTNQDSSGTDQKKGARVSGIKSKKSKNFNSDKKKK